VPDVVQFWLDNGVKYTCDAPVDVDDPSTMMPLVPPVSVACATVVVLPENPVPVVMLKDMTHPADDPQLIGEPVTALAVTLRKR
jgi:hypothetical protein